MGGARFCLARRDAVGGPRSGTAKISSGERRRAAIDAAPTGIARERFAAQNVHSWITTPEAQEALILWRNSVERYGAPAQILHWTLFVLIALQFVSAELIDAFPRESAGRAIFVNLHESLGLAALAIVLIRLAWALVNRAPSAHGPAWQRRLARIAHVGLYMLMVAVPVAGYVLAAARGHDLALFGIELPRLIGRDRSVARAAKEVHEVLGWTMAALVVAHAGAALWHHVVAGDSTLRRMLPRRRNVEIGVGG